MASRSAVTAGPPAALIQALREALEPLIRLCIANGLNAPILEDLMRELFVDLAVREFELEEKSQSQSRVSLITGLHRREVKRLLDRGARKVTDSTAATRGGEIVARWTSARPYVDARGKPLPLARTTAIGGRRSFESLVASFSTDIRSRVVLDEWLRLGVVTIDEADRVCLHVESFIPAQGFNEKAFYFGQNIGDHMAAAASNMSGHEPSFPDRSVYRDELSPKSVARLTRMAERLAMRSIHSVNRAAEQAEVIDKAAGEATHRVNFGFYIYSAPMAPPESKSVPVPKKPRAKRAGRTQRKR